jgi:2-polyprenyl-3-methyl-5-hydroxy-6-metoxy-1,4-benzoquinol methylase
MINAVAEPDPKDVVRTGYDEVSHLYRGDDDEPAEYGPWTAALHSRLPNGATVLDLGCGCGVPVARSLAAHGCAVIGVDISAVQVQRARRLVPSASFLQADAAHVEFAPASFDAVVCLYALIHMPVHEQARLLSRIAAWLRPGGWLLATTGAEEWTGTEEHWLGGRAPMWWSHPDAATYRAWITEAGLTIESEAYVPEGAGGHSLFWARR